MLAKFFLYLIIFGIALNLSRRIHLLPKRDRQNLREPQRVPPSRQKPEQVKVTVVDTKPAE